MKQFWLILVFIFSLTSCDTNKSKTIIYDYVPENAEVVFNINALENLESNLSNNSFINSLSSSKLSKYISEKLEVLDYLSTSQPLVVSFYTDETNSLQFTCATRQTPKLFNTDSLNNFNSQAVSINKYSAQKLTHNGNVVYTSFKDSIALIASNESLLKSLLTKAPKASDLKSAFNIIDKQKPLSVVINSKTSNSLNGLIYSDSLPLKEFTDLSIFDAEISQDQILLNGVTQAKDSTESLINIFKNTIPQENLLAQIAPNNCDGFLSFTFDDFSIFNNQLKAFRKDSISTEAISLFDNIIEVGVIYLNKSKAITLHSIDIISTKDALLSEQNIAENYRQVPIYNFSKPDFFASVFNPLIICTNINYYCILNEFLVFGETKEDIENIIANYQNETTLNTREYYTSIAKNLSTEASILQVLKPSILKKLLEQNLDSNLESSFKDFKISASQYIYDRDYAHFNGIVKKSKLKTESNAVTEILNIKLDAKLLNNPQFVINHITKQKEIVVQDVNNKLYLISNSGNILWKKQLNGPILGKVEQIDIYKNGRLQLAFATPNRVYLIARNGKDVTGYPLKFNDEITQPLSVFDYDKKKNYRLFVTQNKNVLLYDAKGKTVKGFKFSSAKQTINSQPQHIRIGSKDYIIIKTDKELHILSRRGKTRVKPKTKLQYSNQAVFHYKNRFTTISKNGSLVEISTNGDVTTRPLFGENTHLTTTTKTLVAQNENKLKIKQNTLELDFGNYTAPKLFYINDKIYVSVTDLQSQKILLFDSQSKPIKNFPVYGNSAIELDNIDKDRALELVTKGEENSILVYEIN